MRPSSPQIRDQQGAEVSCDVVARGSCRASAADLPALRKSPGLLGEGPLPNGLLRHVDEQTVVGVAAVLEAVRGSGMGPSGFERWSVLAAPRFLGRAKFEKSFPQYRDEGAWGVSPHLIPGHSLHSPSGTISQALRAHGPNLGVGGTPGGEREALLVAATWLESGWAEGIWLVLMSRDPASTGEIAVSEPGDYRAIALALVASRAGHDGPRLRIRPRAVTLETPEADRSTRGELATWFDPPGGPDVEGATRWRADAGHDPGTSKHLPPTTIPRSDRDRCYRELI